MRRVCVSGWVGGGGRYRCVCGLELMTAQAGIARPCCNTCSGRALPQCAAQEAGRDASPCQACTKPMQPRPPHKLRGCTHYHLLGQVHGAGLDGGPLLDEQPALHRSHRRKRIAAAAAALALGGGDKAIGGRAIIPGAARPVKVGSIVASLGHGLRRDKHRSSTVRVASETPGLHGMRGPKSGAGNVRT